MQIRIKMSYFYTLSTLAEILKFDNTKCCQDSEATESLPHCVKWKYTLIDPLCKKVLRSPMTL